MNKKTNRNKTILNPYDELSNHNKTTLDEIRINTPRK